MRKLIFLVVLGSMVLGSFPALAKNFRVIGEKSNTERTIFKIKCDNGKERQVAYDEKRDKYYYGRVGMMLGNRPWNSLERAGDDICEKT
ncbi:MAG: hypothetical protein IIC07_00675 [Proteobacteria bacterium]|nr:hypothetical protein [Pseudomonadota bacterium]MCH8082062.1 hypothetical protein [Pseudomonadota bacterium]MCH8322029.1 hypothetical protein [Pseudomonadota bacterium]